MPQYEITYKAETVVGALDCMDIAIDQLAEIAGPMPNGSQLKYSLLGIRELIRDSRGLVRAGGTNVFDETLLKALCNISKKQQEETAF